MVILLVNSVNAAPLSLSLYFFYILTLNVPCFFFVSGLAACLGAVFSRVFGLFCQFSMVLFSVCFGCLIFCMEHLIIFQWGFP